MSGAKKEDLLNEIAAFKHAVASLTAQRDGWKMIAAALLEIVQGGDAADWEKFELPPLEVYDRWSTNTDSIRQKVQAWWKTLISSKSGWGTLIRLRRFNQETKVYEDDDDGEDGVYEDDD